MINSIQDISNLLVSGFTNWGEYGAVYTKTNGQYTLFNYAAKCQYEGRWNFFERVSRGLILNNKTGEVVARSFDKFFNWGESWKHMDMPMMKRVTSAPIRRVYEKLDGSLVFTFLDEGVIRFATRGSFDSEQAQWAHSFAMREFNIMQAEEIIRMGSRYTFIFEAIYPADKKVVDYDGAERLVLLAVRHKETGEYLDYDLILPLEGYGFDVVKTVDVKSVDELLAMTNALEGEEGYVAEFEDNSRYKFKSPEYLRLHKMINDLSPKRVLEAMINDDFSAFLDALPDEFVDEVTRRVSAITQELSNNTAVIHNSYGAIAGIDRKAFALQVQQCPKWMRPMLFKLYDGVDATVIRKMILEYMLKEM